MKKRRKEADLKNIISQIGGLENRIKYSQSDLDNTEKRSMKDHAQVYYKYINNGGNTEIAEIEG